MITSKTNPAVMVGAEREQILSTVLEAAFRFSRQHRETTNRFVTARQQRLDVYT